MIWQMLTSGQTLDICWTWHQIQQIPSADIYVYIMALVIHYSDNRWSLQRHRSCDSSVILTTSWLELLTRWHQLAKIIKSYNFKPGPQFSGSGRHNISTLYYYCTGMHFALLTFQRTVLPAWLQDTGTVPPCSEALKVCLWILDVTGR